MTYKKTIRDEVSDVVTSIRWQCSRLARTKDVIEREKNIKSLKMSLNSAVSKLAMIMIMNKDSNDKDGITLTEGMMSEFDRLYEMMECDESKEKTEECVCEIMKMFKPCKK